MKNVIAALLTTICLLAALTACGSQTPKETAATSAAEGQRVIRIGFQKYGTMNVLKAQGWLEKRLADAGVNVEWTEFPGGPQLLEALNVGSIDIGHTVSERNDVGTLMLYIHLIGRSPTSFSWSCDDSPITLCKGVFF